MSDDIFLMNETKQAEARSLREAEVWFFGAMQIAAGDWQGLKDSEESAQLFMMVVLESLKKQGKTIRSTVWMMQNLLMAMRKSDFETIQLGPPFLPCVRNHMESLSEALDLGGEHGFKKMWKVVFRPGWQEEAPRHQIIRLSGGPGDSADTAIRVHAPDGETRICAQYWYLYYTYGRKEQSWRPGVQGITFPDEQGREFDVMNVRLPDGEEKKFYFIRDPKATRANRDNTIPKPHSKLTDAELYLVTTTYFAAGDCKPLTEAEGKEALLKFIRNSKDSGFDYVRSVFVQAQNATMAIGEKSFTEMQKLPPFSQFGLMNMVALQDAWLKKGDEGFETEWQRIFASGWQKGVIPNRIIGLTGGPGDCEDTAFRVHAPDVEMRITAEYWYLYYTYGRRDVDWEYYSQALTPVDELGRSFDIIEIKLPNGEIKPTFFVRHPQYNNA